MMGGFGLAFTNVTGFRAGVPVPAIVLSGRTVAENTDAATEIGTLSVVNATGTPTFTLDDDAGGLAALNADGVTIERGATALDYESAASFQITVSVADVTPAIDPRTFTIIVTDVDEMPPPSGYAPTYHILGF